MTKKLSLFLSHAGVTSLLAIAAWSTVPRVAAETPAGGDWPCWRGPANNGISTETSWSPAALAQGAKVLWRGNVGNGYSAPAIKGDRLYTMGNKDNQDTVYCLNAKTGAEIWRHTYACEGGSYPGPRASPWIDGTLVYTFSRNGDALALDAATGTVKWQKDLKALKATNLTWGFSSSPVVTGSLVLYNAGETGVALDKASGAEVWASAGTGNYAAPVVFEQGGRQQVAIFSQKGLNAVVLKDGRKLWSFPWATAYDINAADPIVNGNRVFISSGYGHGGAVLDFSSGKPVVVWENKEIAAHFSSCVLIGKALYGLSGNTGNGDLVCLEFDTGKVLWKQKTGFGSLIAAGGKLIVLNERGTLFICEATPEGYKELATAKDVIPATCWTAPVLAHGCLYLRNEKGALACVDLNK